MSSKIIAGTDFNRDDEGLEYGCQDRIVDICCVGEVISFSFRATDKQDSTMALMFETDELMRRLTEAIREVDA